MRFTVLLAAMAAMAVSTAPAAEYSYTWNLSLDDITVAHGPLGERVSIPGASPCARPGDPALPSVPVLVALAPGMRVDSVTTLSVDRIDLPGRYDIRPMQHAVPISRPGDFSITPRNAEAYSRVSSEPAVSFTSQGSLMGFPVAGLVLRPMAWNPLSGRLTAGTSITFTLHCTPDGGSCAPKARSAASERIAREIVEASVINPGEVGSSGAVILDADALPYGDYLIITSEALVSSFEPLAEFKTMLGVPARIVTVESIQASCPGVDTPQRIRRFLRQAWDEGAPTFVLLAGDVDQVPARNCWATAEGYVDYPAADIYFSDMNDTAPGYDAWDFNVNGIWGEIGLDSMDYHPDYLVGRAACSNASEVGIFVDKMMAYQIPTVDSNDTDPWYTSMGFTTAVLWTTPAFCPGSAGKEKVDTLYTPPAWQPIVKHYEENGTQSHELSMEMLNRGMHFVNHAGHGSETLVSIGDAYGYLTNNDFQNLTNISAHGRVSIWNSLACLSGSFDTCDCLAEAWINSPNGGGFCMMNTRYGWGEPTDPGGQWSDLVDQQFFAEFFQNDVFHLGAAHALAWDQFIPLIPSDTHYDWIPKSITLFGDPELPMWSEVPDGALTVGCPDHVPEGPQTVVVSLSDASGPVAGGRVCIMQGEWNDPAAYAVGFTDASGQASIDLSIAPLPGTAVITGWARNHAPMTLCIPVYAEGIGGGEGPLQNSLGMPSTNPAFSTVSFRWTIGSGEGSIRVMDLAGRVVKVLLSGASGAGTVAWDLTAVDGSPVPSGIYLVDLSTDAGCHDSRRVVVVR